MMLFMMQVGKRPDVSGQPYGFWFGWRPRDDGGGRFHPLTFSWHVGAFWYPGRRLPHDAAWNHRLPRIHFAGRGPIGP